MHVKAFITPGALENHVNELKAKQSHVYCKSKALCLPREKERDIVSDLEDDK